METMTQSEIRKIKTSASVDSGYFIFMAKLNGYKLFYNQRVIGKDEVYRILKVVDADNILSGNSRIEFFLRPSNKEIWYTVPDDYKTYKYRLWNR